MGSGSWELSATAVVKAKLKANGSDKRAAGVVYVSISAPIPDSQFG